MKIKRLLAVLLSLCLTAGTPMQAFAAQDTGINVMTTETVVEETTTTEVVSDETTETDETVTTTEESGERVSTEETESVVETTSEEEDLSSDESETVEETEGTTTEEMTTVETTVETVTVEEMTTVVSIQDNLAESVTPVALDEELSEEIMQRILYGIETYQFEVYIADLCVDISEAQEIGDMYNSMIIEAAEYFWLTETCGVMADTNNASIIGTIELYHYSEYSGDTWRIDPEKTDEARNALMSEVASILAALPENASDLEKAQYAFWYLKENVTYNCESSDESIYTAYGALVNHEAVCQGFMLAYTLLMDHMGIEVVNVVSWKNLHGWNAVKIEDEWYYVDCTWGYFLYTEDQLRSVQVQQGMEIAGDVWYLYSGRTIGGIDGEGDTNLPDVPEVNAYNNEKYTFNGTNYADGYWFESCEGGISYKSIDGESTGIINVEGVSLLIDADFIHRIYFVNHSSDTYSTGELKYVDTRTMEVFSTETYVSGSGSNLYFKDGKFIYKDDYLEEGYEIYTLSNDTLEMIVEQPIDTEYEVGDSWDPAGMEVYSVNEWGKVTRLLDSDYNVSGFSSDTTGSKTITVSYYEKGVTFTETFTTNVSEVASDSGLHIKKLSYVLHGTGDTAQIEAEVRGDETAVLTYTLHCDCGTWCTDCSECYVCSAKSIVQLSDTGKITAVGSGSTYILVSSETETKAVYVAVYTPSTDSSSGGNGGGDVPEGFSYTYSYDESTLTATVNGVSGSGTEMVIPSTTMLADTEYTVTAIEINQWSDESSTDIIHNQITSLIIPDSIKRIGMNSFAGNRSTKSKLKTVTLPKECVIEGSAFANTGLETLTLGSGITLYDENDMGATFSGCTSLETLNLDAETIPDSCFQGCTALTTINWGTNIKTIGQHAFTYCSELKNVVLPEGVESIDSYAFHDCYLESLTLPSTVTTLGSGIIFDTQRENGDTCTLHLYCTNIKSVEYMPNSQIYYVFHGEFTEEQINLFKAFGDPFNYEVVDGTDPGPEEKDEDSTIFTDKKVYLKPGEYYQLKTNYYDMESLVLENYGETYFSVDKNGLIYAKAIGGGSVTAYDLDGNYLESVSVIVYDFAFSQQEIQMQLGETMTLVIEGKPDYFEGSDAFEHMAYTIDGSDAIEIVSVEDTQPIEYGNNILGVCGLVTIKAVNIGNSTLTFSTYTDKIKTSCHVEVTAKKNTFCDGTYYYKELADGTLSITGAVEDDQGFWFNPSPYYKTVNGIEQHVLTIPSKVTLDGKTYRISEIAANAFDNRDYLKGEIGRDHFPGSPSDYIKIVVEEGIERIGNYAIVNIPVNEIVLPSTLQTIGTGAFSDNYPLEYIDIPKNVIELGNGALANTSVRNVAVMAQIKRLPDGLFYGCSKLETVRLADTIEIMGDSAFENCTSLKKIIIPDSVKWIERHVFGNNTALEVVGMSRSLEYIDRQAFEGCSNLKEVYLVCPDFISTLGYTDLFASAYENITFYVSDKYDNRAMLESLRLTEYTVLEGGNTAISVSGKADMGIGETQELKVNVVSDNEYLKNALKWTSSDTNIVEVFEGRVIAKGDGKATVTVTAFDGSSATIDINVFGDTMDEKVAEVYPNDIYVFTNTITTLADVELEEGWSFADETQTLTPSKDVQYINAFYSEEGVMRECTLPVHAAKVDSVSIVGNIVVAKGNRSSYRIVLHGTALTDGYKIPAENIVWNTENAEGFTFTKDTVNGNLNGKAAENGQYTLGVTVSLSDSVSMNASTDICIVEELSDDAFGSLDEPDFSLENGAYEFSYRILPSGTEVEVVDIAGHANVCEIPSSVEYDGKTYSVTGLNIWDDYAGNNGTEVSRLTLPGTITDIRPGSFRHFKMLAGITISGEAEVLKVGSDGALYNQDETYLYWVPWDGSNTENYYTIPASVEDFDAFEFQENRQRIDIEVGSKLIIKYLTDYTQYEGVGYGGVYTPDGKKMLIAPYAQSDVLTVPYGVEEIAPYAFYSYYAPEICIPSTVSLIDSYAFLDTENAGRTQKIYFEEDSCLSQIDSYAFYRSGITHIHLPESVDYIGKGAFHSVFFDEFSVSGNVTTIGEDAFPEYFYPVDIYELYNNPHLKLIKDENAISYLVNTTTQTASVVRFDRDTLGTLVIPESVSYNGVSYPVTKIEQNIGTFGTDPAQYASKFVNAVQIPASVKEIENFAFNAFDYMCRVEFAADSELETIGEYAFYGCDYLQTIILPDSVTTIKEYTESNYVETDASVPDRFVFANNNLDGLESFAGDVKIIGTDIYESDGYYWEVNGSDATIFYVSGEAAGVVPDALTNSGTEYPVTALRKYAFAGSFLKDITLPDSLTTIGQGAFLGSSLQGIIIPSNVTDIGMGAFVNSVDLQYVLFKRKTVPTIIIDVVATFEDCLSLDRVIVPKDSLADYQTALANAFVNCEPEFLTFADYVELTDYVVKDTEGTAVESLNLTVGQKVTLSIAAQPENTTDSTAAKWSVANTTMLHVRDNTITALAAGETVLTVTVSGITKEITVTITEAEKQTADIAAPVLTGSLDEKNRVCLRWNAVEGADGLALYRSLSPDSGFVRMKLKLSGSRTTTLDTSAKHHTIYYYKLVGYKQNSDGTYAYGAESNVVSVKTKYTGDPIAITGIYLTKNLMELGVGESSELSAVIMPENHTEDIYLRYVSEDPEVIDLDEETDKWVAKKAGRTNIYVEAVYKEDDSVCFTSKGKCQVIVTQKVDLTPITETAKLYVAATSKNTLKDVKIPAELVTELEKYNAKATWVNPSTELRKYIGNSFKAEIKITAEDNDLYEFIYGTIEVVVAEISGITIETDTSELYLADKNQAVISYNPVVTGTIGEDTLRYECTVRETSRLGLIINKTVDKNEYTVTVGDTTKTGTGKVKVDISAVDQNTGTVVYKTSKTVSYIVKTCEQGILVTSVSRIHNGETITGNTVLEDLQPGDLLVIEAESFGFADTSVKFATANKKLIALKESNSNSATFAVTDKADGITKITITAKGDKKVQKPLVCAVKNYKPVLTTTKLSLDKNQTAGADITIHPSYGVVPEYVSIKSVKLGKNDINGLFEITSKGNNIYNVNLSSSLSNEEIAGMKNGTYKAVLEARWDGLETPTEIGTISIKVSASKPSITVKQTGKVNLFYAEYDENGKILSVTEDSFGKINITGKKAVIREVMWTGSDFTVAEDGTISLKTGLNKTASELDKKITVSVTFEGYRDLYTIKKDIKLQTSAAKPKVKITAAESKWYTYLAQTETKLTVTDPYTKKELTPADHVTLSTDSRLYEVVEKENAFYLTLKDGVTAKTENVKWTLSKDGWKDAVSGKTKITVDTKTPSIKLSANKLTLNSFTWGNEELWRYEQGITDVTIANADSVKVQSITVKPKNPAAKKIGNKISVFYEDGQIKASLNDKVNKGSYTYTLETTALVGDNSLPLKATTLTVSVIQKVPSVKVKAKGSIDVLQREQTAITYTLTISSLSGKISRIELTGQDADHFNWTVNENGSIRVSAKEDAVFRTDCKYQIRFAFTLITENGSQKIETNVLTIKVKQGKVSLKAKQTDGVYPLKSAFKENGYALDAQLTISKPVGAVVENISLIDPNGSFELLNWTTDENGVINMTVALTETEARQKLALKLKKAYKLKLEVELKGAAENVKPVSTNLTVKVVQ